MSKWGKCQAEGREHTLNDFQSRAVMHRGQIVGHTEVCKWCQKPVRELIKK